MPRVKELVGLATLGATYYDDGARATASDIWSRAGQRADLEHREMMGRLGEGGEALVGDTIWSITEEMLAYEAEAFDANTAVDYADVTAQFAQWRGRLKAVLERIGRR